MVHDAVWANAGMQRRGFLCLSCLEDRLLAAGHGRLNLDDFTSAPCNASLCFGYALAARSNPAIRRWRDSGVAWFWSSDREDFVSVILEAGRYVSTTVRGSARFSSLADAKSFVEEHSS